MSLYESLTRVLAPFAEKIKGIQTGYDGTTYSSPGEAVRDQIWKLHVLIGDVPGTAIQASAVAYNNSNVAAELTNVNGLLQQEQAKIGDLSYLQTEDKTDLVSAINEAAQSSAQSAVTCTVDGNGDATFALGEEDLSDIAALIGGTA